MLTRVDRLQVTAKNRREVAERYRRLLDAEVVKEDKVAVLDAERTVLRVGESEVEILEPDGVGRVANWMGRTGGGLFAAGFATPEPAVLAAHLRSLGRPVEEEGGQIFLTPNGLGLPGLHAVITEEANRQPAGLARALYEVTSLVANAEEIATRTTRVFRLDPSRFVPIRSDQYGYTGVLTLFQPDALDRIEIVTPFDDAKTMGRFFRRKGPRLYMAYLEADDTAAIRARLLEHAPEDWTGRRDGALPDNLFIHPKALAGVMLGVSRTTFAWTWSGHPERVEPNPASPPAR